MRSNGSGTRCVTRDSLLNGLFVVVVRAAVLIKFGRGTVAAHGETVSPSSHSFSTPAHYSHLDSYRFRSFLPFCHPAVHLLLV